MNHGLNHPAAPTVPAATAPHGSSAKENHDDQDCPPGDHNDR